MSLPSSLRLILLAARIVRLRGVRVFLYRNTRLRVLNSMTTLTDSKRWCPGQPCRACPVRLAGWCRLPRLPALCSCRFFLLELLLGSAGPSPRAGQLAYMLSCPPSARHIPSHLMIPCRSESLTSDSRSSAMHLVKNHDAAILFDVGVVISLSFVQVQCNQHILHHSFLFCFDCFRYFPRI